MSVKVTNRDIDIALSGVATSHGNLAAEITDIGLWAGISAMWDILSESVSATNFDDCADSPHIIAILVDLASALLEYSHRLIEISPVPAETLRLDAREMRSMRRTGRFTPLRELWRQLHSQRENQAVTLRRTVDVLRCHLTLVVAEKLAEHA